MSNLFINPTYNGQPETPSIENINNPSKYEFYAGVDKKGKAIWTNDFKKIKPLLEWNNNMGCVTITYNEPSKKIFNMHHRWWKYLFKKEYLGPWVK